MDNFEACLSYALSSLKCSELQLKDKQIEAIRYMHDTSMMAEMFSFGCQLGMANLYVSTVYLFCWILSLKGFLWHLINVNVV